MNALTFVTAPSYEQIFHIYTVTRSLFLASQMSYLNLYLLHLFEHISRTYRAPHNIYVTWCRAPHNIYVTSCRVPHTHTLVTTSSLEVPYCMVMFEYLQVLDVNPNNFDFLCNISITHNVRDLQMFILMSADENQYYVNVQFGYQNE